MIHLLLALVITTTVTPDSDIDYLGSLLCGESCGMGREAMQLVSESIVIDYLEHGRHWLDGRWYAPLKPNKQANEIIRETLELEVFRACRLIGNGKDWLYWSENNYLPRDAVPDYIWTNRGMTLAAFDCVYRAARIRPVWECNDNLCPM